MCTVSLRGPPPHTHTHAPLPPPTPCVRRPHAFKVVYTVSLHGEALRTAFTVHNADADGAFDFTGAMHSYFEVLDINVAKVRGLQGLTWLDKARARACVCVFVCVCVCAARRGGVRARVCACAMRMWAVCKADAAVYARALARALVALQSALA